MRIRDLLTRINALEVGGGASAEVLTAIYTFDTIDGGIIEGTLVDSAGPLIVDDNDLVAEVDCIVQGAAQPQPYGITGSGYFSFAPSGDAELIGLGGATILDIGPWVPLPFLFRMEAGQRFRYTAGIAQGDAAASGCVVNVVGTVLT